ncbi:glycosyltransferase family 4 protein [Aeromicrobium senzhongii]|uniref:Glycosyltransferase family 4 protein n=1 Tax=Aeromicrobium senzhongii TaxID=2663859 RepID=A0ABX6SV56_9ACTN|nr:glycosyltransferase [Aeromicrobium senzhongii]QNL94993.1 glycosyltransferase family 4 protein [Aeromicrobium senzhongii]
MLIGAYAASPGEEPEAGAGWALATAAAADHDVWLVTRPRFRTAIEDALAQDPELAARLTVVFHDLAPRIVALKRRNIDLYWYYVAWQYALGGVARRLHRELRFDVVHHATWANDWLHAGVSHVRGVPFVWGPVGGASAVPLRRLGRWLGRRGLLTELVRGALTRLPRRVWGDRNASRAAVVVAQNHEVAARFRRARRVVVEPNAALDRYEEVLAALGPIPPPPNDVPTAVFVGRLVAWKGVRLAVEALTRPAAAAWHLDIYGDGYEREALESLVQRHGLGDRVAFLGHRPRTEVLAAFARADAMLFPSMHDQAGWVAAEASSLGCPVVCLPLGGPHLLAGVNARVVSLEGDIPENLAEALAGTREQPGVPHDTWARDRLVPRVRQWYADAMAGRADAAEER